MLETTEAYLRAAMPSGALHRVAGGDRGGTRHRRAPAWRSRRGRDRPTTPPGARALVLNVYTEPEFRRQGIARRMMETVIAWCREQGLRSVSLHASDFGRALYEDLGFRQTNEMRLYFK